MYIPSIGKTEEKKIIDRIQEIFKELLAERDERLKKIAQIRKSEDYSEPYKVKYEADLNQSGAEKRQVALDSINSLLDTFLRLEHDYSNKTVVDFSEDDFSKAILIAQAVKNTESSDVIQTLIQMCGGKRVNLEALFTVFDGNRLATMAISERLYDPIKTIEKTKEVCQLIKHSDNKYYIVFEQLKTFAKLYDCDFSLTDEDSIKSDIMESMGIATM